MNVTNDPSALDFLVNFLEDDGNISLLQDEDVYEKIYREFWNNCNDNSEQKRYDALLDKAINKTFFKPDLEPLNFGMWNNRMSSILAISTYFNLKWDFNDKQDIYWQFLTQAHGVDTVKEVGFLPDSSTNSSNRLIIFAEEFDTNPNLERKFSQQIVEHPLYDAIQEIRLKKQTYLGEKHVEAAAFFDLELNDPLNSWNALISASYWAGKQQNQAIEPIWEAAIYLAEKENWTEIHHALTDQYAFYNFYKDKV